MRSCGPKARASRTEALAADHVMFWHEVTDLVRVDAGDPTWELRRAKPVVLHWFRLVETGAALGGPT